MRLPTLIDGRCSQSRPTVSIGSRPSAQSAVPNPQPAIECRPGRLPRPSASLGATTFNTPFIMRQCAERADVRVLTRQRTARGTGTSRSVPARPAWSRRAPAGCPGCIPAPDRPETATVCRLPRRGRRASRRAEHEVVLHRVGIRVDDLHELTGRDVQLGLIELQLSGNDARRSTTSGA